MAITKPSSLKLVVSSDLVTDYGQGRVTNTPIMNEVLNIPFQSFVHGSVDITSLSGTTVLGKYAICFLNASAPITVNTLDASGTSTHVTKMFALNGDPTEISISTSSVTPVTVSFIQGTAAV